MLQLRGIYRNGSVQLLEPMPNEREREVLVTLLPTSDKSESDYKQRLRIEQESFHKLHPSLVQTHLGKYVAIYQGEVVDEGDDSATVYARIRQKYGSQAILISKVEKAPVRKAKILSPRIVKR